ncbi:hypothetical protein [Methanobrevibacter sp.]|uniref:hypothetical protein n=1 Tax=Methanobrevibacter sp. TaxID=66852 RepID=UPI00388D74C5
MQILDNTLVQLVIVIAIFLVFTILTKFIYNNLISTYIKSVNINEILPEDEVHSLRQVFYLILMALCVVNIFYTLTVAEIDYPYLAIFDIALSLYFAALLDTSSRKNKIILLLLIPYGSLSYLLFNSSYIIFLNIIHILVFIYFAKQSFDKFMEYTNSNGLGITIILLFVIIFASFFITQYSENVNPLDSLVIVSNQFTGNGYSVFGYTIQGKMNSLLLVWGGYVMSGVSAATLTAAILIRHFKKEFKELKELIEGEDE